MFEDTTILSRALKSPLYNKLEQLNQSRFFAYYQLHHLANLLNRSQEIAGPGRESELNRLQVRKILFFWYDKLHALANLNSRSPDVQDIINVANTRWMKSKTAVQPPWFADLSVTWHEHFYEALRCCCIEVRELAKSFQANPIFLKQVAIQNEFGEVTSWEIHELDEPSILGHWAIDPRADRLPASPELLHDHWALVCSGALDSFSEFLDPRFDKLVEGMKIEHWRTLRYLMENRWLLEFQVYSPDDGGDPPGESPEEILGLSVQSADTATSDSDSSNTTESVEPPACQCSGRTDDCFTTEQLASVVNLEPSSLKKYATKWALASAPRAGHKRVYSFQNSRSVLETQLKALVAYKKSPMPATLAEFQKWAMSPPNDSEI